MFSLLKHAISDRMFIRSINRYGSKMGGKLAAPFSACHDRCKAVYRPRQPGKAMAEAAQRFALDGFTTHWSEQAKHLADSMLGKIKAMEAAGTCPWSDDFTFMRDPILRSALGLRGAREIGLTGPDRAAACTKTMRQLGLSEITPFGSKRTSAFRRNARKLLAKTRRRTTC